MGVGFVVGCVVAVGAGAGAALAAEAPPPDPTALWNAYPLQPPPPARAQPAPPAPPAAVRPPAPSPAASPRQADDGGAWPTVLLAGAGALLAVLAAVALVVRRPRRRSAVPAPMAMAGPRPTPEELISHAYALATEAAECNTLADRQREGGNGDMTETSDQAPPGDAAAAGSVQAATTYADIGERVAGVLSAAEDAAQQIRAEARSEAEHIRSAARTEADAVRREADAYDTEIRTAVETFASERRREADTEVQRLLSDSETQARATRQAAEAMARQIEQDGIQRGQALRDESKVVEERLKKALVSFRRITVELEELVGAGAPATGESLADALRPYGERAPLAAVPSDDVP
jgi:hypothetical protein